MDIERIKFLALRLSGTMGEYSQSIHDNETGDKHRSVEPVWLGTAFTLTLF